MSLANRRSIMTVYSDNSDIYSHQVRIVLAEKGVAVDVRHMKSDELTEELLELNPYGTLPTLVDRDLVLYHARIVMEYLDERFPHPPLLPVYPVARAESRRMMFRIENDWYSKMRDILEAPEVVAQEARKAIADSFTALSPVFGSTPYFLSEEFSLVDCCLAPLLWRFPSLGIELPKSANAVWNYAERIFERESFQQSLTESERELRDQAA
jgi:RNA polymerase-associated protein